MQKTLLAALAAASLSLPAYGQTAVAPAAPSAATVVVAEERIPVPEQAPGGSSSPMGVSAGVSVGVVVIGVGLIIACGIACAN